MYDLSQKLKQVQFGRNRKKVGSSAYVLSFCYDSLYISNRCPLHKNISRRDDILDGESQYCGFRNKQSSISQAQGAQ